jgi:hypothetical protein
MRILLLWSLFSAANGEEDELAIEICIEKMAVHGDNNLNVTFDLPTLQEMQY